MGGVELGARYKVGKDGARVSFRHGDVLQLAPFSFVMFRWTPLRVEGRLLRVGRRGTLQHEAPALEPAEVKYEDLGDIALAPREAAIAARQIAQANREYPGVKSGRQMDSNHAPGGALPEKPTAAFRTAVPLIESLSEVKA